ncbi:MAG: SDR family NAD(P)-dependent oxidoreductase, partial [Hyphomicrobiaceae bacterium]
MSGILITGAAGGIARPLCLRLAGNGHRLHLVDRPGAPLDDVVQIVRDAGGKATTTESLLDSVEACSGVLAEAGPLFALVHLAGVFEPDPLGPEDMEIWDRALGNNLTNAYILAGIASKAIMAEGLTEGSGRMVFISSLAFNRGSWEHVPYACAKGGLVGLIRASARRYAPKILVNGLAPGIIDTPMPAQIIAERGERVINEIPLRRFGHPDEVAGVIQFLLGPDSS